jgi:ribosomal protein S18 acetylase RimI-like enzyme
VEVPPGSSPENRESVSQLYVRVGCQRGGTGGRLQQWAKQNSGGSLWLYTFKKNQVAQAFYESRGFVAVQHGFEPSWKLDDVKYYWSASAQIAPWRDH